MSFACKIIPFSPMTALSVMPAKIISTTIVTTRAFCCRCWLPCIFCTPFVYIVAVVLFCFVFEYFSCFFCRRIFAIFYPLFVLLHDKTDKWLSFIHLSVCCVYFFGGISINFSKNSRAIFSSICVLLFPSSI